MKIGNILKWIFKLTGIAILAWIFTKATGKDCGCEERQERLNGLIRK